MRSGKQFEGNAQRRDKAAEWELGPAFKDIGPSFSGRTNVESSKTGCSAGTSAAERTL